MKEETCEGPEAELGSGGAGGAPGRDQPGSGMEPQEGPEEPGRGRQQRWEAQWQHFLQALQAPSQSAWGSPQGSEEATPWEDAKAFLASFEQVALACGWPQGEWVTRLRPALSGDAQQAFGLLAAGDQEDYGKVKAAILRGQALRREAQRQHFRQFCCPPELGEPRRLYGRLQELCCRWLRPERHTKEQILELLVLEQFLASLPGEVQSWVRAGGPDSGAQAVALLEECLLSRREADTRTWQVLLQALGPLEVKEEPLDTVQGEIPKGHAETLGGIQQSVFPGTGIAHPNLLLPLEGQDVAEAEMTKALGVQVDQMMNPRKTGAPLHMVEQTPAQSSQQTTFWKVLQEEGENVDSLEGSLGLPLDSAPHPVEKEETFLLDLVECLPGKESDDETRIQLKVKNSQYGGNEPLEIPRTGRQENQENVPVTAEMQEAKSGQGTEPFKGCQESGERTEGLGDACSYPSPMDTGEKKATFSKHGRRYYPKSGLVFEHTGEVYHEGRLLGEKIQPKSDLGEHPSGPMEEEKNDCPEFGGTLHSNSLANHQTIRAREKAYKCPDCGKGFFWKSNLRNHQSIHTGEKPHKCSDCGKGFSRRATLLIHQMIHTGQKPHQCPECGRSFAWKSNLRRHQSIHTGEKPHKCPDCGNTFSQRSDVLAHQTSHSGKKPHQCPERGKEFPLRSKLLIHQSVHTREKPHKCLECGKSFSRRATLLIHQTIHTGEKPHQCPECGRHFFWKSNLQRHRRIHTGKKPHKFPACGKTIS